MYFDDVILGDRAFSNTDLDFSGNPSWEAWNEIFNSAESGDNPIRFLLSIGTGRQQQQFTHDRFPYLKSVRRMQNLLKTVSLRLNDREREHEKLESLAEHARKGDGGDSRSFRYYRLDPRIERNEIKLYGWKKGTKLRRSRSSGDMMDDVVNEYLLHPEVQQDLDRIAYQLVQRRRQRCKTRDWDVFATGRRLY